MNGAEVFAIRENNAINAFVENVQNRIEATREQALDILATYKKFRLVTLDRAMGTYKAKTGQIWDAAVLRRALNG